MEYLFDDQKIFYLLNEERTSRAGIDYGDGTVLGLPFESLESTCDDLAQAHADDQLVNNTFSHTGSDSSTPFTRIDNSPVIGGTCSEFISYVENLAGFWSFGGTNSYVPERAVYNWIYEDASSTWGHRRLILIQNTDSYGGTGFNNDNAAISSEGYVGIGIASSSTYDPYSFGGVTEGVIVVLKIFDPKSDPGCVYGLLSTEELVANSKQPIVIYPRHQGRGDFIQIKNAPTKSYIDLFDVYGNKINSFTLFNDEKINVSSLSNGLYFLNVQHENKSWVLRFIKR